MRVVSKGIEERRENKDSLKFLTITSAKISNAASGNTQVTS